MRIPVFCTVSLFRLLSSLGRELPPFFCVVNDEHAVGALFMLVIAQTNYFDMHD